MSDEDCFLFYGLLLETEPRPKVGLLETIVNDIFNGICYSDLSSFSQKKIELSFSDNFWNILRINDVREGYINVTLDCVIKKSDFLEDIENYNVPISYLWEMAYVSNEEVSCITIVNEARCHKLTKVLHEMKQSGNINRE